MTRIAFTADLHCDDYGTRIDPSTGLNARWVDTVAMARWVAEDAKARGADVLAIGGDLTEGRHPAPWRVAQIKAALDTFGGAQLFVRGNHDGIRDGRWIGDVVAIAPEQSSFAVPGIRVVGNAAIAALPYLDRHQLRAMSGNANVADTDLSRVLGEAYLTIARGLFVQAKALAPATVLVVHQALAGGLMSDSQAAFLGDQGLVVDTRALTAIGFEAVLAGHFHKHQVLSTDPLVVYAGSPYRVDFGEEHQAKGYLVVDIEPGRATFEFIETPARRFVTLTGPEIEAGVTASQVDGAIVRVLDLDPLWDAGALRRELDAGGAFEVQEIRQRRVDAPSSPGGLSEDLTPAMALEAYFAGDPDREPIVERGRELLVEVGA